MSEQLEGLSLSQFWDMKDLAKGAFWVSQNIYPETMGIVQVGMTIRQAHDGRPG